MAFSRTFRSSNVLEKERKMRIKWPLKKEIIEEKNVEE